MENKPKFYCPKCDDWVAHSCHIYRSGSNRRVKFGGKAHMKRKSVEDKVCFGCGHHSTLIHHANMLRISTRIDR